jgi:hypothetical protein
MAITITLTRIAPGSLASIGVPFARGVLTETRQLTAGGLSLFVTPTLYWYDALGVPTSIKAVRLQFAMPEDALTLVLSTSIPMPVDWPLADTPFSSVSHSVTPTIPSADYTIVQNGSVYEFAAINPEDLQVFDTPTREPNVLAHFEDGYLASTNVFGPMLSATDVAADPDLAGVKFLSDAFRVVARASIYADTWAVEKAYASPELPYGGANGVESWLYDRHATYFLAYVHTNEPDFLRAAYQYAWWYMDGGQGVGHGIEMSGLYRGWWKGKWDYDAGAFVWDGKYNQTRGLYYYYALTGDEGGLAAITALADGWKADTLFAVPYMAPPLGQGKMRGYDKVWTERLLAAAWCGTLYGFMATGNDSYLQAFLALLSTAYTHISTQDQATLDAITVPYVYNGVTYRHPPQNAWIKNGAQAAESNAMHPHWSPWMSSLVVAPLLSYQEQSNDPRVDEIFIRLGRGMRDSGLTYKAYTTWGNDTFLAPKLEPDAPPVGRIAVGLYGVGKFIDNAVTVQPTPDWYLAAFGAARTAAYEAAKASGFNRAPDGAEDQHAPDNSALTAAAQRSLVRRPELDEGAMTPFDTERECVEAMHHELSYVSKSFMTTFTDDWIYTDPSRPPGTYHIQSRLAVAYAGGQASIDSYIASTTVGHSKAAAHGLNSRRVSWMFNHSMYQFGLMQAANFSLPTIIRGWVEVPTPANDQVVYPGDDVSDGGWTGSVGGDLSALVDEPDTPSDADFITSPAYPVGEAVVMTLPGLNRPLPGDCVLTVRARTTTPLPPGPLVFEEITGLTGLTEIMQAWYDARALVDPYPGDPTRPYRWWPAAVCAADLTGSGRADLVVAHHGVPGSAVLIHQGLDGLGFPRWANETPTRELVGSFLDIIADGSPHVGDVNNDGYPDIISPTDEGTARVALNDGTGRFNIQALDIGYSQIRQHDTTSDGWIDIVGLLTLGDSFSVYQNDQDGTFTESTSPGSGEWIPFTEAMRLSVMEYVGMVTFSDQAGTLLVTWPGTQMANNKKVRFRAGGGGALPSNISAGTDYWVRDKNAYGLGTFRLALTQGGSAIAFVEAGTQDILCYGQLTYPTCRKVAMGGAIGEIVFVSFGEGYTFHEHPQLSYALRLVGGLWSDVTAELGLPTYRWYLAGVYDFNRNGYPDLLLTDCPTGGIYRNTGAAALTRQVDQLANDLAAQVRPEDTLSDVADFDEDGKVEILLKGGRFGYNSCLYQNQNDQYVRALRPSGPGYIECWVPVDVDGDGRLDLIGLDTGTLGIIKVWLNKTPAAGNWINVHLSGDTQNKVGIDARVEVYTAGHIGEAAYLLGVTVNNTPGSPVHMSVGGEGTSVGGKLPIHVGLGPATSVDVKVIYPSGTVETALAQATNQTITV